MHDEFRFLFLLPMDRTSEFVSVCQHSPARPKPKRKLPWFSKSAPLAPNAVAGLCAQVHAMLTANGEAFFQLRHHLNQTGLFGDHVTKVPPLLERSAQRLHRASHLLTEALQLLLKQHKMQGHPPSTIHHHQDVITQQKKTVQKQRLTLDSLRKRFIKAETARQERMKLFAAPQRDCDPHPSHTVVDMTGIQQQDQMMASAQEDTFHDNLSQELVAINECVGDIETSLVIMAGEIFEQGQTAKRIEEDVFQTLRNTEGALTHLLRYQESLKSNRWLLLKVFGILLVFFVFFVVFLA
eukprot:m.83457 g.83457  ORF g.83457 m.83457 type:complete len:296 (+) comp21122_c0_seq2:176-1063(+)